MLQELMVKKSHCDDIALCDHLLKNLSFLSQDVFDFWLRRNVDGFRISAVSYLYEDKDLKNELVVGSGNYTSGLLESTALLYKFRSYIDNWVKKNSVGKSNSSKYV